MKRISKVVVTGLFLAFFYQYGFMSSGGAVTGGNSPTFATLALCTNGKNAFVNEMAIKGIGPSSYWTLGCVQVS